MEEALSRSLAAGNTAEIFEWGPQVMKLYKNHQQQTGSLP